MFVLPSRDDLVEHRVVVTTLSTSQVLLDLQVLHGFFTHILIDEAAQALEPEALTPLIFAGPNTKVVFTGDHMQVLNCKYTTCYTLNIELKWASIWRGSTQPVAYIA